MQSSHGKIMKRDGLWKGDSSEKTNVGNKMTRRSVGQEGMRE